MGDRHKCWLQGLPHDRVGRRIDLTWHWDTGHVTRRLRRRSAATLARAAPHHSAWSLLTLLLLLPSRTHAIFRCPVMSLHAEQRIAGECCMHVPALLRSSGGGSQAHAAPPVGPPRRQLHTHLMWFKLTTSPGGTTPSNELLRVLRSAQGSSQGSNGRTCGAGAEVDVPSIGAPKTAALLSGPLICEQWQPRTA